MNLRAVYPVLEKLLHILVVALLEPNDKKMKNADLSTIYY